MMVAHKIALDPNNTQRSYFARASGTARFAYNWALGEDRSGVARKRRVKRTSMKREPNGEAELCEA
jgi:hypothetical protein